MVMLLVTFIDQMPNVDVLIGTESRKSNGIKAKLKTLENLRNML